MERIYESSQADRIRGSLIGGAAGDALGYPVEFMSAAEIFHQYGRDGITSYELSGNAHLARVSDDTQMTLFTANGILFAHTRGCLRGIGGTPSDYMMQFYQNWLLTQEMNYSAYQILEQQIEAKKERGFFTMNRVSRIVGRGSWMCQSCFAGVHRATPVCHPYGWQGTMNIGKGWSLHSTTAEGVAASCALPRLGCIIAKDFQ